MNFSPRQRSWLRRLAFLFFAIGLPIRADAHLVTSGLGPVYDGMEHMLLSPDQWIMVVGLALLAGLNGPAAGRAVLFSFPGAWLAGGCAGHFIHLTLPSLIPGVALLIVGGLVAADLKAGRNFVAIIANVLGFLQGYLNGVSFGATNGVTLTLLGASIVAFVIVAFGAALVVNVQGWRRIVVRVAGSWMVAIGVLLVGWTIRKS
ncbi:MAG: HupE/UreJ family protein [Verrucomicrobiota bacterium]